MEKSSQATVEKEGKELYIVRIKKFLKQIVHLIPFFVGFVISRFYQISFENDIFLIGILITAVLLFKKRAKVDEPPYPNK